ncbi:MAG TPA: hypothetical protein VK327_15750 [Candidatus Paceibacterota bacterium]|nr:hypothetical protein [Candidatus Paceibacterota bacterium]
MKRILLVILAAALLFGSSRMQNSLNRDREALGLTLVQPLDNAPPVLAFTTVALGGFRGLISNMLWIRANDLQQDDKFFEMAQLSDWITKLEPHFSTVWTHLAWNMAYNISVKFKQTGPGEYPDRWRWVKRGIELLRDEGLKYNPDDVGIHQQLAWIFQHKLGANLDDANMYYKQQWLKEMGGVLGTNLNKGFDELIEPKTDDEKRRAELLRDKYKMDPALMKTVDERYGPLEWRLPEAHAIYWAAEGLERAKENPTKVNASDLIQLRRVIYQTMLLSFQRGRLITNSLNASMDLGPNLDIIPHVNEAYESMMREAPDEAFKIENGHRSFLRQAVYSLYVNNRVAEAAKWFKYLGEKYPNKPVIDDDPKSFPRNLTLEEYAVSNLQVDINETSRDRIKAAIEGFLTQSFHAMILGQNDRAVAFRLLANKVWDRYHEKIPKDRWPAIGLPPVSDTAEVILKDLLNPENGLPAEARAILRTEMRMQPEEPSATTTNSPSLTAPVQ